MLLTLLVLLLLLNGSSLGLAKDALIADCNEVNHSILSLPVGQHRFSDSSGMVNTKQFYTYQSKSAINKHLDS